MTHKDEHFVSVVAAVEVSLCIKVQLTLLMCFQFVIETYSSSQNLLNPHVFDSAPATNYRPQPFDFEIFSALGML